MGELIPASDFLYRRMEDERRRYQKKYGHIEGKPVPVELMAEAIRARAHLFRLQTLAKIAAQQDSLK